MSQREALDERTDLFLSLTPERILDAVEAGGLRCNPVCYPLNSYENRVYEIELEDETRIIAKFYRPGRWSHAQILEEHQFLQDLVDAEIPVCPTLPFPEGDTLREIDGIPYCLFARRGGRAPDELDDGLSERLGMLVGRLHNVGAGRAAPHRLVMTPQAWLRDNLAYLLEKDVIPTHLRRRYEAAAVAIAEEAEARFRGVATHRVHGDLHLGNLLLRDGSFNLLDFDDMVIGPAVQDLWMIIPGRDRWAARQRDAFLTGYEQFRSFDQGSLGLIEPLRAMRMVHYSAWLARRWHDPIFPRTWPHFPSQDYWEQEARDLEELAELLHGGPAGAASVGFDVAEEAAPELTNADYFFDWDDAAPRN